MYISIEISPGELLDRITILTIKLRHLSDPRKRAYAAAELKRLQSLSETAIRLDDVVRSLVASLEAINAEIWRLTDEVYRHRAQGAIDSALAEVCLRAFELNSDRSEIKHKIDVHYGSAIREVKNYGDPIEA
jgi:hypothetical protein